MPELYEPFELRIGEKNNHQYPVTASFRSGSWMGSIPENLPLLSTSELDQAMQWLERGFIDRPYAQDLGKRLFQTLFPGDILDGFRSSCALVHSEKKRLRIILTLPKDLAGLPWELAYDDKGGEGFLARSITTPLSRYSLGKPVPHKLPADGPLRVLIVAASPQGLAPISSEKEMALVQKVIQEKQGWVLRKFIKNLINAEPWTNLKKLWRGHQRVEIELLTGATRLKLQQSLADAARQNKGYHVVHFIGHARTDKQTGGQVVLEAPDGSPDLVPAVEFAEIVAAADVCLVVLNACQTASSLSIYDSLAEEIMKRRVPAVIGMQVQVLDISALEFAHAFYGFWASGESIEAALTYARRMMARAAAGAVADWSIPVLFMGLQGGLSLELKELQKPPLLRKAISIITALVVTIIPLGYWYWGEFGKYFVLDPMDKGFNIAVAEFGELQGEGRSLKLTNDSRYITEQVAIGLQDLLKDEGNIQVALQPRMIGGYESEGEDREREAQRLAEQVRATVVVFGLLDKTNNNFVLEIFVSEKFADVGDLSANVGNPPASETPRLYSIDAQGELVGSFQFGAPIDFRTPLINNTENSQALEDNLLSRLEALSWFTLGLANFNNARFDQASELFLKAEAAYTGGSVVDEENTSSLPGTIPVQPILEPRPELAVFYLFQGASLTNSGAYENILVADEVYEKLILIMEDTYPRAYLGRGNLNMAKAIDFGIIDEYFLDLAIDNYKKALEINTGKDEYLDAKAYFNLGKALTYKDRLEIEPCPNELALKDLDQAILVYEESQNSLLLTEIAAKSYYQLGQIYTVCAERSINDGSTQTAVHLYRRAEEAYSNSLELAQPNLVQQPGWLGLPIFKPPPEQFMQYWNDEKTRCEISSTLGATLVAHAELGETALYDQAIPYLMEVTEYYESNDAQSLDAGTAAAAYFNLGLVYERTDQVELAIQLYNQAKKTNPDDQKLVAMVEEHLQVLNK